MTITDIVTNIDRRLAEMHAEIAHLQGARLALINGSTPAPAPKARTARQKRVEPNHQVVPAARLRALLTGTAGLRTAELAKAASGDRAQVLTVLKQQESAGEIRRTGTRAATRWHVITDEARVAARAAERARRAGEREPGKPNSRTPRSSIQTLLGAVSVRLGNARF
jgi:anti-sigma factor RsiW